jgi:hypothetical protein
MDNYLSLDDVRELYPDIILYDGFDEAIIGVCERHTQTPAIAYSTDKIIDILMSQGMNEEEAWEYFDFNVFGAWVGEATPYFIDKIKV